jgi:hypothetical protein
MSDFAVLARQDGFNARAPWSCWNDTVVRYAYTSRFER